MTISVVSLLKVVDTIEATVLVVLIMGMVVTDDSVVVGLFSVVESVSIVVVTKKKMCI